MNRVSSIIHLDYARQHGLTGQGIGVAILDTGIDFHPDFYSKEGGYRLAGFLDLVNHKTHYYDDNGHGTHTTGILTGNGSVSNGLYCGVAPECHFYSIKVLGKNGEGHIEHVLEAIHWLLQHYKEYNIRIVNISIGSTRGRQFDENSPLVKSVNSLWEHGLVVLTAAGNHGPAPGSIGAPGNSRKIITVGSSDPLQYRFDSDYSSRGPTNSCIKKPDIVAPGSRIVSLAAGSSYQAKSGTSMSTPIVAGCIALLLEKYPDLTNHEIKLHLRNTALDLGYSHTRQGWGLIQCDRMLSTPPTRL